MEEAVKIKENVNPVGGGLWGSFRRERKSGRLGVGGVGLGVLDPPSSRERPGVLAPNSTLGNRGGAEALEWLKDRVSQHKLVSKNGHSEVDSGSRHPRKHVLQAVDGNDKLCKSSGGLSASKEVTGTGAGREQQSAGSHRCGGVTQSIGAKSPWPAPRGGQVEVYDDHLNDSQDRRRVTGRSREASNVKPVEKKSPAAANLIACRGSPLSLELEDHSELGGLNSPSNVFLSKFQLQQDQVCVKKLVSPQPTSQSLGSGLWSGSKRPGTPYKPTGHQSRGDAEPDRPGTSSAGEQHFRAAAPAAELNLTKPECGRSLVTLNDRREVNVEGGAEGRMPSGAASMVPVGSAYANHDSFATKSEDLKVRIQQGDLRSLYPRKSPTTSVDSSTRSNSGSRQHGAFYTYRKASPLAEEEVSSSPRVRTSLLREGGKNLQGLVIEDKAGGGFSVEEPVPHISPALESLTVEHYEPPGHKIACGSADALCEKVNKNADSHSEEKADNQVLERSRRPSPPPARIQTALTLQADLQGSVKSTRSMAIWSRAEAHPRLSPSEEQGLPRGDGSKENTSSNMDVTAVGQHPALLYSLETGASSSCSSSTPSLLGNSSLDDITVKSREPTPLADAAGFSSGRVSKVYSKPSNISKRSRSLGPASRVLRDSIQPCNSSIRTLSLSPIIDGKDVEIGGGQLEHPSSDPRKRKAERDLSTEGDTSQILEHSNVAPAASAPEKDVEAAVPALRQSVGGSTPGEQPSRSGSRKDVGELARPHLPTTLASRGTELQEPRIAASGRVALSGKAFSVPTAAARAASSAVAGHQRRTSPANSHDSTGASEASKDSFTGSDGGRLQIKQGAETKLPGVREPALLPVGKREHGTQIGNDERMLVTAEAPADSDGRNNPAEDMSHDGFSSSENKENEPIPVVPDLSNCLNSLSLGEEDISKKEESKLSSSSSNRVSEPQRAAPSSHVPNSKAAEICLEPPSTSHSARSGISVDTSCRDQVRISPDGAGNPEKCELAGRPARRSPIRAEHPESELLNKAALLPCSAEARAVPSERARDSGASTVQSADATGKEKGASATSQKKMSENSHFVWVNNMRYQKLGKIGKGGSSEVFKVIDSDCNIYAMKKINLKGREHRSALGFYQEIEYLERLRGKRNVIQLIDYEVSNREVLNEDYEEDKIMEDACIYVVLEFGEIDFASILSKKRKEMLESGEIVDGNWLRFYWKHMLLAVKTIHDERIVHADLKPANFLLVKGELKLIDFGIAKAIQNDTTHIVRDCQVGTLNYMSPEAFMTNSVDEEGLTVKCGRSSDIWSLGCILYQMVYGHTPFSQVDSFYAKIQAITSKTYRIRFPPIPDLWLQDAMKKCLTWDRHSRPQITDLLEHPFLRPELANQRELAL